MKKNRLRNRKKRTDEEFEFQCRFCQRSFESERAARIHEGRKHCGVDSIMPRRRSKVSVDGPIKGFHFDTVVADDLHLSFNEQLVSVYKWKVLAKDDIKHVMIVQVPME